MDDPLLMSVLDSVADLQEQFETFARREAAVRAELADLLSFDQFHRGIGQAGLGGCSSSTRAMFGWSIMASAWRSASKRAMTLFVSNPGFITFNATRRRTGWLCSAR